MERINLSDDEKRILKELKGHPYNDEETYCGFSRDALSDILIKLDRKGLVKAHFAEENETAFAAFILPKGEQYLKELSR